MFLIRKLGSLLRGSATPFQIHVACILGALMGFTPGFTRAPALALLLLLLLLICNANLLVAGLIGAAARLASLALMPVAFSTGRWLLDGPTSGLFRKLINAPVGAWCGLEYYVCAGGLLLGLLFGIFAGFVVALPIKKFRAVMGNAEASNGFYARNKDNKLFRLLFFVLFGSKHKLDSYKEVAGKKALPIRVGGVVVAAVLVAAVWFGVGRLSGPLLTRELKSALEAANGATVDVTAVELDLPNSRLAVHGLAMADKESLDHDLFRATTLEGSLSGADFLRKRFKIDRLVATDAAHGASRATPGVRITPPTEPTPPPPADSSGSKTLDDYLSDAKTWEARLKQAKEWLDKYKSRQGDKPGAPGTKPDGTTLRERLEKEAELMGYGNVAATHLIEGSPAMQIGELIAEGIKSDALGGRLIDLKIENLSTDPGLVDAPMHVKIATRDGNFGFDAALGSEARVPGQSFLDVKLAGVSTDALAASLEKKLGHKPVSGGTLGTGFRLAWSAGTAAAFDTPLNVAFKDTTVELPKLGATNVKEFTLPLGLKGPLDNPRISLDPQALVDSLMKAGATDLANKLKGQLASEEEALKSKAGHAVDDALEKAKTGDVDALKKSGKGSKEELTDEAKKAADDLKNLNPFGKKKKPDPKPAPKPDAKPDGGGGANGGAGG
jgi:uncharacterized protein (TIGR03546 family)